MSSGRLPQSTEQKTSPDFCINFAKRKVKNMETGTQETHDICSSAPSDIHTGRPRGYRPGFPFSEVLVTQAVFASIGLIVAYFLTN